MAGRVRIWRLLLGQSRAALGRLVALRHWQAAAREPALSVLLGVQVLFIFVVTPLANEGRLGYLAREAVQVLLPLVSFFVLPPRSRVRPLLLLSLGPMLGLLLLEERSELWRIGLHLLANLAVTAVVARAVVQATRVSLHQLLGAVVVYLNMALLFAGGFSAFNLVVPGAFGTFEHRALVPGELLYFSLSTLTSTGFGDILPVHPLARSAANLESVLGQLFVAIFLARMVSLHSRTTEGD